MTSLAPLRMPSGFVGAIIIRFASARRPHADVRF
jgi:hypothetical protein